jgi:hypothetical protein
VSRFKKAALGAGLTIAFAGIGWLIGAHYFRPESAAIFWHQRHGDFVDADDVRLHVPSAYVADGGRRGAILIVEPGLFAISWYPRGMQRVGKMEFWFQDKNALLKPVWGQRIREYMGSIFMARNFHHVADRAYSLAGRDGICSEYSITSGVFDFGTRFNIVCTFGEDGYAEFEGTSPSAADFYKIIESAQPVTRKN